MAEKTITLRLTIDPSGAITAVNDVVAAGQKGASALESPFANIAARGFGIKAVLDGLSATFGTWIRASNEGERAVASFEQSVRGAGGAVEEETARIRAYASARQEATGIDDDATVAIAAQLRAMNLQGEQLENAIDLTQDLSTLMGGDMNGAVRVIADAFNGNTGMLKRYVKGLDEADIKQRGTISIIEQLTKAVGGQAVAVGETGAGGMKKLDAAVSDLQQTFGDLLKTALAPVVSTLTDIIQAVVSAPRPIQVMTLGVTTLAGAFTLLGTSMGGIPFIIGGIVTGIAALTTWLDDLNTRTEDVEVSAKGSSGALDELRSKIARLKVEASDTEPIRKLIEEIDQLRNPVTELTLARDLDTARKASQEAQAQLESFRKTANLVRSDESAGQPGGFIFDKDSGKVIADNANAALASLAQLESAATAQATRVREAELKLEKFRLENRDKQRKESFQILGDQLDHRREIAEKTSELELETALFTISQDEKTALSRATSEEEKLNATRQASLDRIAAEERAALAILEIEERLLRARRTSAPPEERTRIDRRLETITVERTAVTTTAEQRRQSIELDIRLSDEARALPGTIRALEEQIRADQERLGNARTDNERQQILQRIQANQSAVEAMKSTEEELLAKQRAANEEKRRMWQEQHQTAMVAINAIGAGFAAAWSEIVVVQRQAKDTGDRIWLAIENTALTAIGRILQQQIEAAIIDKSLGTAQTADVAAQQASQTATIVAAKTAQTQATAVATAAQTGLIAAQVSAAVASIVGITAAVTAAMAAIITTASTAATLVSIATFGGAAATGTGAVLAGLATVRAASAVGFERGGIFERDQRGFIEGGQEEIIAPRRTFEQIMREEVIPLIVETTRVVAVERSEVRGQRSETTDMRPVIAELRQLRKDLNRKELSVENNFDGQQLVRRNLKRAEQAVSLRTK